MNRIKKKKYMYKVLFIGNDKPIIEEPNLFLKNNIEIEYVLSGSLGVQNALLHSPQIIVSTIETSDFTGIDVFNMVKEINSLKNIPFLFCLFDVDEAKFDDINKMSIDGYFKCPIEAGDLLEIFQSKINMVHDYLQMANNQLNNLLQKVYVGVFIYKNNQFEFVNERFCAITGYSENEILGGSFINIVDKNDIKKILIEFDDCLHNRKPNIKLNCALVSKQGEVILVDLLASFTNMNNDRQIIGFIDDLHYTNDDEINNRPEITKRERDILYQICEGLPNKQIAANLSISVRTVETHRLNLMEKLGAKNAVQMALLAVKYGYYKLS